MRWCAPCYCTTCGFNDRFVAMGSDLEHGLFCEGQAFFGALREAVGYSIWSCHRHVSVQPCDFLTYYEGGICAAVQGVKMGAGGTSLLDDIHMYFCSISAPIFCPYFVVNRYECSTPPSVFSQFGLTWRRMRRQSNCLITRGLGSATTVVGLCVVVCVLNVCFVLFGECCSHSMASHGKATAVVSM